jgi:CubicO group peptidase (beta-lactamase class C family)
MPDTGKGLETLDQVAQAELQAVDAPGAALAVVRGEDVLFAKGLGVSSSETREPVTPDTLFRIGSLTKVVTAYTLISLVLEQHLSVHAPIAQYVPDLPLPLGSVTIHQLLSHTSGLKDDDSDYGPHDEEALGSAVRRYDGRHFFTRPGRVFSYSGLGYAVAGVVIEALGQRSFTKAVVERVLGPLRMTRSTFLPTQAMTHAFSQGHTASGTRGRWSVVRPYDDNATRWPAGFLFSSVTELARFCVAFMNDGRIDGDQVLDPEVISALAQPYARPLDAFEGQRYGYGLNLGEYRGMRTLEHGGGRRGFCSYLQMFPEQEFAFIQLVNRRNALLKKTQEAAIEQVLRPDAPPPPAANSSDGLAPSETELEALVGRYDFPDINAPRGNITVYAEGGKLRLRFDDWMTLYLGLEGRDFLVKKTTNAGSRFSILLNPESSPIELAFQKLDEQEDYLCALSRAFKRASWEEHLPAAI